jgi:hypothetical protein
MMLLHDISFRSVLKRHKLVVSEESLSLSLCDLLNVSSPGNVLVRHKLVGILGISFRNTLSQIGNNRNQR